MPETTAGDVSVLGRHPDSSHNQGLWNHRGLGYDFYHKSFCSLFDIHGSIQIFKVTNTEQVKYEIQQVLGV